jgi:hypothetical protein
MNASLRTGEAVNGQPLMKFTLTYDGELRSNGDPKAKWEIRNHLSPQLEELWSISPALKDLKFSSHASDKAGYPVWEVHHSVDLNKFEHHVPEGWIDLCPQIERKQHKFVPLVRETLALRCGLKINFMRKEEPGRLYQGGDLDNRLKTLFDALAVPNMDQTIDDPTAPDPIYCLMEDDSMIAGCEVETHRLLSRPNSSKHEVRLVIEVDIRVIRPRVYNYLFLGD